MSGKNWPGEVRALRRALGMTQEQFAHEVAVTVSTVNRWERGHVLPSKLAIKSMEELAARNPTAAAA